MSWLVDKVSDDTDFEKDTAVHRFRGNIIIKGCNAFDEMQWQQIRIGNNNFKVYIIILSKSYRLIYVTNIFNGR